jgi:hypothetical protein
VAAVSDLLRQYGWVIEGVTEFLPISAPDTC